VRALTVLLGLQRRTFVRLGVALALFVLALVLAVAAFSQLIGALRLALLMWIADPALASLITGLILLLLAWLMVVVARLYLRRRVTMPQAAALGAGAEMTAQLMSMIRRNPGSAALVVALVGFVVGALPELRRALGSALGPAKPKRHPSPPPAEP
jgi:hypothetical protein